MNAYELAIKLDACSSDMEYNYVVNDWKLLSDSADMLRHQADYIKHLEEGLDSSINLNKAQAERQEK